MAELEHSSVQASRGRRKIVWAMVTAGAAFLCLLVLLLTVDRQMVNGHRLGLAGMNLAVFTALGVNKIWDWLTDALLVVSILIMLAWAGLGVKQFWQHKSWRKVDLEIRVLAVFYVLLAALYGLFTVVTVNYRPLTDDIEASFPSSHVLVAGFVLVTAGFLIGRYVKNQRALAMLRLMAIVLVTLMVMGRLLAGVHWLTDVLGAVLLVAVLSLTFVHSLNLLEKAQVKGVEQ